ncbi:hypothetical protein M422DRAFT_265242 [Sphaerobolus stellatus SS14]|uniref:Uncharacterized protein n=1 Tax=Sphaerobolus stellatus (strain SS14) TaxID=990650 RepID=A0A0C9TRX3_SPHS4|nr:hypothetical protein M422DRAFT_265242 [Sphaerobolus stellatus SS14]
MASTTVFGNFTVADGAVVNAPNNGRSYALYRSSTYTADLDASIPTLIRCYLPTGASPFPNNITVFLYGKICTPVGQPYLIEAINMFPYPGNPDDATYSDVPAFAPRICILGHVSGNVETTYEGRRVFRVQSATWVRDQLQATNFMAFFENSFRWKKTNTPNADSAVYIIGPVAGRHENNLLLINVNMVLETQPELDCLPQMAEEIPTQWQHSMQELQMTLFRLVQPTHLEKVVHITSPPSQPSDPATSQQAHSTAVPQTHHTTTQQGNGHIGQVTQPNPNVTQTPQQLSSQSRINGIPTNNATTFNPATDGARELELINQGIEAQEQEYTAELRRIQCAEHRSVNGNLTDESVESTPSTQVTSSTTRGKKRGRPPAQKSTTGHASRHLRRVPSNDSQPENNPADDTLPPPHTHSASGSNDVTIID